METRPTPQTDTPSGSPMLVVIGVVVAIIAVIMVNAYVHFAKQQTAEETFVAWRLKVPKREGDTISRRDIDQVQIPVRFEDSIDRVAINTNDPDSPPTGTLTRDVASNRLLLESHFIRRTTSSIAPPPSRVFFPLPVTPEAVPGKLRPDDRVDILIPINNDQGGVDVLTVMENVRVVLVGAMSAEDLADAGGDAAIGRVRTVTVDVPNGVENQLSAVHKAAAGDFEIGLRSTAEGEFQEGIISDRVNDQVLTRLKITEERPRFRPS